VSNMALGKRVKEEITIDSLWIVTKGDMALSNAIAFHAQVCPIKVYHTTFLVVDITPNIYLPSSSPHIKVLCEGRTYWTFPRDINKCCRKVSK